MNHLNKNRWRTAVLTLLMVMLVGSVFAQELKITGKVTQKSTGEVIPGATVVIDNSTKGTITNYDGIYTIQAKKGSILSFSFIGFKTLKVEVTGTTIDAALEQDYIGLDEVVAIGYGVQKKSDITGSVASIGSKELTKAPIISIDAGMQGKMPGVTLQKTSGAPGQAMKIRIRGGGSVNYNNEPLYVIDGFIGGDLISVSPQDIERIDILKDASATAIYGSRGANGVVLITTKTAKQGDFKITLDATYGVSNIVKQYDILDAGTSAEYWNIQAQDLNELTGQTSPDHFTDEELTYYKENGGENYLDLITRSAVTQDYNLSMSGGNEKLTYMFSGGYVQDQGVIQESFRKRFSIRSNIKAKIRPWLDLKFNTYATSENSMNTSQNNRAVMDAYMYPIFWANKDENGKYIFSGNNGVENSYYVNGNLSGFNGVAQPGERPNPVQYNEARSNGEINNTGVTSSLDLNFKFSKHLELMISGSGRYYSYLSAMMPLPDGVFIQTEDDISVKHINNTGHTLINTDMLTYKNDIGDHHFSISGMYEYSAAENRGTTASVDSLATLGNSWYIMGNGKPQQVVSNYTESYMQSYMGRANYSYANKYLLTATLRVDQTSVFSKENRTGYFPSFAAGWVLSEEDFLKTSDWIQNLKLRAGYGQTGNQAVGAYATQSRLSLPTGYAGYLGYETFNGNDIVAGVLPQSTLVNPNIKWETTAQTNFGVDFGILDGRVNMTADYYSKTTSDVILQQSVALYNGRESVTDNYGEINNKGFEFMIDWRAIQKGDFTMRVGGNISMNRNKVLDLGGKDQIFLNENLVSVGMWGYDANNVFVVKKGESMGLLYGIKEQGLWQVGEEDEAAKFNSYPGMPKYEDLNEDGKIDGDDRQVIGHTQPDFTGGINVDISYKDISLYIGGFGSYGNDIYNYNRHYMDKNMLNVDYNNRWSPTNSGSTQQRIPVGTEAAKTYVASQYVENGSFFKINNLTLSYNVPKSILSRISISNLNVFGSVNNLLTITKYSGIDPENSTSNVQSDSQSGIDSFSYPLSRTVTFGLKATF